MLTYPNCAALINAMRRALPVSEALSLRIEGILLRIMTNNCTVRDILTRYYCDVATEENGTADILVTIHDEKPRQWVMPWTVQVPEAGKTRIQEEYFDYPDGRLVHRPASSLLFAMTGEGNIVLGPCEHNADQIIEFINSRYLEYTLNSDALLANAAVLSGQDRHSELTRGLGIVAPYGMGKLPLALHTARLGAEFMGNDRICLLSGETLIFQGLPRQPHLRQSIVTEESLKTLLLPETGTVDTQEKLNDLEKRSYLFLDECFGAAHFSLKAPLNALIFLQWQPDAGDLQLHALSEKELRRALGNFIRQPGLFYLPRSGGAASLDSDTYCNALRHCACFCLTGSVDFDAAARLCMDFLETGQLDA